MGKKGPHTRMKRDFVDIINTELELVLVTPFGDLRLIKDRAGSNQVERIVAGVSTIFLIGTPTTVAILFNRMFILKINSETCLYEEQVKDNFSVFKRSEVEKLIRNYHVATFKARVVASKLINFTYYTDTRA